MSSLPNEPSPGAVATTTEQGHKDAQQLERLGYNQELRRTMSTFSNFAATFSYISVTTGIFALFAFGLGTGGPAFFWSWPIVFGGRFFAGADAQTTGEPPGARS